MASNQKPTGRAVSIPVGLAIGAAVSVGITLLAAAILGKLVETEKIKWENLGYGVMILILSASFMGSTVAYAKIKRQRFLVGILSGVVYFGILLSITALFFGGQYDAVGVTAALILAGSAASGLLRTGGRREGKRKWLGRRYR